MSTEDDVRKASTRFYAALNRMCNGNAAPMADILVARPGSDDAAPDRRP